MSNYKKDPGLEVLNDLIEQCGMLGMLGYYKTYALPNGVMLQLIHNYGDTSYEVMSGYETLFYLPATIAINDVIRSTLSMTKEDSLLTLRSLATKYNYDRG